MRVFYWGLPKAWWFVIISLLVFTIVWTLDAIRYETELQEYVSHELTQQGE